MKHYIPLFFPLLITLVILCLPTPQGLAPHAWHFFAIFVGVITGLIFESIPGALIGLTAIITISVGSKWLLFSPEQQAVENFNISVMSFKWAVSGFSNSTVWLIFSAFIFSISYEKTMFGRRLALILIKYLGRYTLTLGYAIAFADLILAPFTPSNTARSGGTIYPIISNLPPLYGSKPNDPSAKLIGSYIMWVAITATCITSSMFASALAPNLLALVLVKNMTNITISWSTWFLAFLPLGILLLLSLPLLTYWFYPPGIKENAEVSNWAKNELKKLGVISSKEILLIIFIFLALICWIFATAFIEPAIAGLMIVVLMLLSGILDWNDIIGSRSAWNIFIWFATLITLATGLYDVGFITWLGKLGVLMLSNIGSVQAVLILVFIFYLLHYLFASTTAHTTALLPVMIAIGADIPENNMTVFCLLLMTSLGIMGIITPYGTGPSPIYYGSGYISTADYWRLGAIFGAIFIIFLLLIGYPWMTLLF